MWQAIGALLCFGSASATNFVFIKADDMGWGDPGYNGGTASTPVLDEIAHGANTVLFSRFYGRTPRRDCIFGVEVHELPANEFTIAQAAKQKGLRTAHFGKWCGCSANTNCGCLQDIKTCDVGHYKGNESKMVFPCQQYYHRSPAAPAIQAWPGKSKDNDQEFLIDRFEEFLNSTIEDASTGKRSPFLASVDFHSVHIPYVATPKYRSMYAAKGFNSNEQDYYGALTEMDEQIGRLRQLLVVHGVANDTMLFFTSDNGPEISPTAGNNETGSSWPWFPNPGSTGGLRGRKRDLTEGGIRVPGWIEWPAMIKQNLVTDFPAATVDYLPTLLAILEAEHPHPSWPLDGTSLLPVLAAAGAGAKDPVTRTKPLGWQFKTAHGNHGISDHPCATLRARAARARAHMLHGSQSLNEPEQEHDEHHAAAASTRTDNQFEHEREHARSSRTRVGVDPSLFPALTAAWAEQDYKLFGCRDSGKDEWTWFLYSIRNDSHETKDLSDEQPAVKARMVAAVTEWQASVEKSNTAAETNCANTPTRAQRWRSEQSGEGTNRDRSRSRSVCNVTGYWTYAPEPKTRPLQWLEAADGAIACFSGTDFWRQGSGRVNGKNVTLVFGDQACKGAAKMSPIRKWGTLSSDCNTLTMNDAQPNCATPGSCKYVRVPAPPPPPAPCKSSPSISVDIEWLSCRTKQIILGCRETISPTSPLNKGIDARFAYTPDATHSYGAQWTRDFQYTVSGAPELMDAESVKRSVRYTFAGQRTDGCMPDRVQIDGQSVMSPGGMLPHNKRNPSHDHAWDNGPFAALLLASTVQAWPDKKLFCDLEPAARRALDFVNRSADTGLVYNNIDHPNCTYGFTDTVAKTGSLLFTSLLYIDASQQLGALSRSFGCGNSTRYETEAAQLASSVDRTMADPNGGPLWLAATHDNAIPDVWGSAYLVALNLSTAARRQAAMDEMVAHKTTYFRAGQVRSMPFPAYWTRCCWTPGCKGGCPAAGTYQNGAYWATPLSYVTSALLATGHAEFAEQLLSEAVADFMANGIYEDVDYGFPAHSKGVLNYTASATNVLWAAKRLHQWRSRVAS